MSLQSNKRCLLEYLSTYYSAFFVELPVSSFVFHSFLQTEKSVNSPVNGAAPINSHLNMPVQSVTHNSTNQKPFEKHLCYQSGLYEKCGWLRTLIYYTQDTITCYHHCICQMCRKDTFFANLVLCIVTVDDAHGGQLYKDTCTWYMPLKLGQFSKKSMVPNCPK